MEDSKTNPSVDKVETSTASESSTLEICDSLVEKKKILGVKQGKEASEQIRGSSEGKDIGEKKKSVEIEKGGAEASRNNPKDGDCVARDNEGTTSSLLVKKPEVVKIEEDEDDLEREDEIDPPEVGIVGPPTAVRDLVNEEELGTTESSSLPSDNRNENRQTSDNNGGAPDVAEWIERSRRSNDDEVEETGTSGVKTSTRRRKKSFSDGNATAGPTRKSQRIVTSIIRRSIKCLNKMHAAVEYGSCGTGKKLETEKRQEESRESPKVAQSRQNGAALPEEAATAVATSGRGASERLCPTIKCENHSDGETERQSMEIDSGRPRRCSVDETKEKKIDQTERGKAGREKTRKRRSTDTNFAGNPFAKKICFEERERFIEYLVGTTDRVSAEELASRADQLRAQVQALDKLARAKEMEWNEILSMRKLKEEAYLRIERRRQVVGYMESGSNGQLPENVPPASLSLVSEWESPLQPENSEVKETSVEEPRNEDCQQRVEESRQVTTPPKREKINAQRRATLPKRTSENGRKTQQVAEQQSLENRQIGEGRQGPIVDVRSIIADYRLRHPETVPRRYDKKPECPARPRETLNQTSGLINVRRGRRMRNSVNIGLGAGGAMVETGHNADSRPSSTDSCKSNTNASLDPNNSMSFKDVLVQFAKLSQQQGEAVKTPQNYPDVTLHPVTPSPVVPISSAGSQQPTGSLLHGILTKSQSPRPTTFSPTLARLLTAPERERNTSGSASTTASSTPQHRVEQTQHLLQAYQGSNPVSISDLLSSSKARTEITITPVINPMPPNSTSQTNSLVQVDDVDEDTSLIDDRDSRLGSGARDNRDERDSPPRCQGCQERAAQFVCAGCGNQWYCSRDCQVAAWDEHSEVCSG